MGMSLTRKITRSVNKSDSQEKRLYSLVENIEIRLYRQRYRKLFPTLPTPIMTTYPERIRWFVTHARTYEILAEFSSKAECIDFCRIVAQDTREQVFLAKMSDDLKDHNLFEYSGPIDRKGVVRGSYEEGIDSIYERKYLLVGTKEALLTEDLDQELREWDRKCRA